jgi:GNAT superfamily N-acetyltransferase
MSAVELFRATRTEINPPWLDPGHYVEFLNRGFSGQWDRASYDFYLGRAFNGARSDLLVRAVGTRILAGISLCYRQVHLDGGSPIWVCVASTTTTLPAERRCGHYGALLEAAVERCAERGCAALLGFVTHGNGSGRGLTRMGARAIPSFYVVSSEASGRVSATRARPERRRLVSIEGHAAVATLLPPIASRIQRFANPPAVPRARFHYERPEDWAQQFLCRPHPVRALRLSHDSYALIEAVGTTDRLQWLACPHSKMTAHTAALAAASAAAGRKFFMYTLDPLLAQAAHRSGLEIRRGYLLVLPLDLSAGRGLASALWTVQSGDRL